MYLVSIAIGMPNGMPSARLRVRLPAPPAFACRSLS